MPARKDLLLPRYSEYNVSRLGLISIQSKLPERALKGWESHSITGEGSISCRTAGSHIPHGLAGDIFAALVTETVAARTGKTITSPENTLTPISLTVMDIIRLIGLEPNKTLYDNIRADLLSLQESNYKVSQIWRGAQESRSEKEYFSLIYSLNEREMENLDKNKKTLEYRIILNPRIMDSIDSSLVLVTDTDILNALKNPGARGMYRVLEAQRRNGYDFNFAQNTIVMTLHELIESCRLLISRQEPARLIHQINQKTGPLEQLVKAGYLKSYTLDGRGWETKITFKFVKDGQIENNSVKNRLIELGIDAAKAANLAVSGVTIEAVQAAVWKAEKFNENAQKQGGLPLKNPPGYILKTLKDPNFEEDLELYRKRPRTLMPQESATKTLSKPEVVEEPNEQEKIQISHRTIDSMTKIWKLDSQKNRALHKLINDGVLSYDECKRLGRMPKDDFKESVDKLVSGLNLDNIEV